MSWLTKVLVLVVVVVLVMNIHFAHVCDHHNPSSGDNSLSCCL
jgi:hypothetical protein